MHKPFEIFTGDDGRLYQAGIDGEVFDLLSQQTYSAIDAIEIQEMSDSVSSARRLKLNSGEQVLIRFIPSVLNELGRYRVATHWWYDMPIICTAYTEPDLIPHSDRICPFCELADWMEDPTKKAEWLGDLTHAAWMPERAHSLSRKIRWEIPVLKMGYFDEIWKFLPLTHWVRPLLYRLTPSNLDEILAVSTRDESDLSYRNGFDWVLERERTHILKPGKRSCLAPTLKNQPGELERLANQILIHVRPPLLSPLNNDQVVQMIETILAVGDQEPNDNLEEILRLFPNEVVLVPQVFGTKMTQLSGWPDLTAEIMCDSNHRRKLNHSNKALLTGSASGNICTVDVDDDLGVDEFIAVNSWTRGTMFSYASRGGNFYFKLRGKYPHQVQRLFSYRSTRKGKPWGEFRAGVLTTLDGVHPKGMRYRIENPGKIPVISYSDIVYPNGVRKVLPAEHYDTNAIGFIGEAAGGNCLIDTRRLKGLHYRSRCVEAQCPACWEDGGLDKSMNHLVLYPNGKFGCCLDQSKEHYARILSLAGIESIRLRLNPTRSHR